MKKWKMLRHISVTTLLLIFVFGGIIVSAKLILLLAIHMILYFMILKRLRERLESITGFAIIIAICIGMLAYPRLAKLWKFCSAVPAT